MVLLLCVVVLAVAVDAESAANDSPLRDWTLERGDADVTDAFDDVKASTPLYAPATLCGRLFVVLLDSHCDTGRFCSVRQSKWVPACAQPRGPPGGRESHSQNQPSSSDGSSMSLSSFFSPPARTLSWPTELALLGHAPTDQTLDFVVPRWTSITTGVTGDTVIVLTAPTSTAPVGNCAPPGVYPLQDALIVDGKGERLRTYLIKPIAYAGMPPLLEGVKPGTRIRNLTHLRTCQWGTKEFDYYQGIAD